MKIGLDVRMINYSGIGRYIRNVLSHMLEYNNGEEFILYGKINEVRNQFPTTEAVIYQTEYEIYKLVEQVMLPFKLKGLDIFHSPHYNFPILYKGKVLITVHDIIHFLYPIELRSKLAKQYSRYMFKKLQKKAHKIITDSESTKRDLIEYFKFKPENIEVIYIGVDPYFKQLDDPKVITRFKEKLGVNGLMLMFVGLNKYHKNIQALLKVSKILKEKKIDFTLLLAGTKMNEKQLLNTIEELGISQNVKVISYLDDLMMLYAYNAADIFILPSFYEGFGLPPLEAMACGTPVIVSNASSLPEVVGDAGLMINPKETDEIVNAIIKLSEDSELYNKMVKKGLEHVKKFSWADTARKTYDLYKRVINE